MSTTTHYSLMVLPGGRGLIGLETLSLRTGVHPAIIEHFVELGFIEPSERLNGALSFDPAVVPRLRTIRRLHESLGVNVAGIGVILELLDRINGLQQDLEFLKRDR